MQHRIATEPTNQNGYETIAMRSRANMNEMEKATDFDENEQNSILHCNICGDTANVGRHYGSVCCSGCKGKKLPINTRENNSAAPEFPLDALKLMSHILSV